MQPGSLRVKGKPSNWRHCRNNQRWAASGAPRSGPRCAGTGPRRTSGATWRVLLLRTAKWGLPWITSEGRYFRFSPHREHTTKIELAGKLSVPANTSWPHFLQQTTQDLGKGRARIGAIIG